MVASVPRRSFDLALRPANFYSSSRLSLEFNDSAHVENKPEGVSEIAGRGQFCADSASVSGIGSGFKHAVENRDQARSPRYPLRRDLTELEQKSIHYRHLS